MSLFKAKRIQPSSYLVDLDRKEQALRDHIAEVDALYNQGRLTTVEHIGWRDHYFARLNDIEKARKVIMSTPQNTAQQQLQIAMQQQMMAQQMYNHQALHNQLNQLQQHQLQQYYGLANQQVVPQNLRQHAPKPLESTDHFGELIGYRCWRVPVRPLLCSVHMHKHVWTPGAVEECDAGEDIADNSAHGFHAWKTMPQAVNYAVECGPPVVVGSVKLWGTVLCHERGYRSQFAKIASLEFMTARYDEPVIEERAIRLMRKHYGV